MLRCTLSSRRAFPAIASLVIAMVALTFEVSAKPRARDLGIPFGGEPGPLSAITDVPDVEVGHVMLIEGEGELKIGKGPVRTGVTAILPTGKTWRPAFAAWYAFNGNGEMTGINGNTVSALPEERLCEVLRRFGRLKE